MVSSSILLGVEPLALGMLLDGMATPVPGTIDPVKLHKDLNRFWNGKACARMEKVGMLRHDIGLTAVLDLIGVTDLLPGIVNRSTL